MKAKFGMIVTEGRGKIGGHVASRNRSGAYFRTKVTPVNPRTIAQQNARAVLSDFSQNWRGLSQAQRDAWDAAVQSFASTDIFGDLRNPTGKNLYTRLNTNLVNVGISPISVPPLPSEVTQYLADTLTIALGTTTMDIGFIGSNSGMQIQIWATDGVSPGVGFFTNRYRLLGSIAGDAASPYDMYAMYVARFGAPVVGTKIAVQLVGINSTTGQAGVPSSISAIVAA